MNSGFGATEPSEIQDYVLSSVKNDMQVHKRVNANY